MAPKTFRGTFVIDEGQAGLTDEATTRVQDAATRWIEMYVRTARNEAGVVLASQRVRDFLLPALGTTSIGSLTGDDIRGYRLWIERTKRVAPQTVAHLLADLRCMLNWAVDGGLIEHSPFPRRAVPRIQEVAPCRLSDDEVEALVHLPEHYGFIARLGIGTGLRWGELVRARADHVNENGELVVARTKSHRLRRIPLSPALLGEVRSHVGRLLAIHCASGFKRQVVVRTCIKDFHPHRMRHTFACRWLEAGGSLAALQELLGHASIVTTQRYGRLGADMIRREAGRVYEEQHRNRVRVADVRAGRES